VRDEQKVGCRCFGGVETRPSRSPDENAVRNADWKLTAER
jgi:hypothetical protein